MIMSRTDVRALSLLALAFLVLPPALASQEAVSREGLASRAMGPPVAGRVAAQPPTGGLLGPAVLRDLRSLLDTGVVLQDRNGDGVVDFVDVSILLPPASGEAEVAAAANIAARLGFETGAMNLGLAVPAQARGAYPGPVILVGAGALEAAGVAVGAEAPGGARGSGVRGAPGAAGQTAGARELLAGLAPGQGVLAHLPPGGAFASSGVAVVGYDATGLLEASAYLSGRYPGVWAPDGTSWREVAEKVEAFAAERELEGAQVALDRIVVDANRPGVARARVTVAVEDGKGFRRAVEAFTGLDTGASPDILASQDTLASPDTLPGAPEGDTARAQGGERAEHKPLSLRDLEFRALHRLDVLILGPGETRTVTLRPKEPWDVRADGAFRPGADATFSLPGLYQVGGLLRDSNRDLVPDETAAYLSLGGIGGAGAGFGGSGPGAAPAGARAGLSGARAGAAPSGSGAAGAIVDLAARVGLETAGIRLPLARVDRQEDDPSAFGFPVLLGPDHYQIRRLQEEGKLPASDVAPGVGFVQFVEKAFGERNALAVGGVDEAGFQAAAHWMAWRAPYLWTHGKGEYRLEDAETEVRRFLQARGGEGQAALALTKLGAWMDRMEEDPPARIEVELTALEAPDGLAAVAEAVVRERFPEAELAVTTWPTGFGVGDTVFVQEWDIPWEVDEVREILSREVYPALRPGAPATVEIRVSEPPEIRSALEEEIRRELAARGAGQATVHVLNAYKQGYSWIVDVLLPRLRELPVAAIDFTYHTLEESEEIRWQTIAAETRWLQEVYPFDAILARELGISDTAVVFHPTRRKDPIYTFEAKDSTGALILRETFDPRYVVRPFFDLFPEYEQVRVTTGWVTALAGGDTLVDRRVATDPERFWDRLQTETFSEIITYIMDIQDGDPSGDNAPFFDAFKVDLRLSEPNHRIGVDEEIISSLEALHEDIFFQTHTLFTLLGNRYHATLSYPGRVLPFVDPTGDGEPGRARLSLTGKERGASELVVRSWREGSPHPELQRYRLNPLPVTAPGLVGAAVADGEEGLRQILARVTVSDSLDRYPEMAARSSEETIDRQFISVELLEGMLSSLARLHRAGMMEDVLAWDRVGELLLDFRLEKDSVYQRTVSLTRSRNPRSTDNPRLSTGGWRYGGESMVQWDTPIPPEEHDEILARLGTFPEVTPYYLTDSYLGHRVWAADFLPPHQGAFLSQAKLNALRPTLFVSGREHGNEVSSTSHMLRLGELLVTDSAHRALLDRVNVVLHPMANPDGAAVAYERQLVNPDHMLHVGRPGALGVDATVGGGTDDPVYPEAMARPMIREAWLPDIFINPHGYPSHEWVQYFAGYSAWVRSRRVGPRDWWVPRGWFIPGFSWVDDRENPDYKTAQFAILDSLAAAITGHEEVEAMNQRMYARYRKYGEQERRGFTEYFHNGMVVNLALRGAESIGSGVNSPRITYFSVTTEAPDETARGEWMELMNQAGLAHTTAALRYLATGENRIEREVQSFDGAVTRKVFRVKPVLPKKVEGPEEPEKREELQRSEEPQRSEELGGPRDPGWLERNRPRIF
jgi:hypothetical protein